VGLPQLDFRVPEATWFKGVLAGRFSAMPGLSSTGALAWPYKIAVVAVMAIVACGTLVTFGSAGAETPSSSRVSALPGSDEANPTVQGQVVPPSSSLLNGADLLSTLNLTDYSPGDTDLSLFDDNSDDNSDSDSDNNTKKPSPTPTPTTKPTTATKTPTTSPTTSAPSPTPTQTSKPSPSPTPEPTQDPKPSCTALQTKLHLNGC
jgi:outer membrane biosynthesis protein TonB